ncbi:DUF2336 domain-containing protein [Hypericibacter sp.]|uniref:DUF2336 domain-containing protein n=1 Tax=Hypericibacter sp. TaxID=2705401 RepID=UPI003D6CB517
MTTTLSQADVARLLTDPSQEARADTAAKLAEQVDAEGLTDAERQLAIDIVRVMAQDAAIRVREALSRNLKHSKHLPHDVAEALARDVEQVALPILEFSTILTDEDLIAIIRGSNGAKQTAIARRAAVSAKLADALIASKNPEAVATLVSNPGAELAESHLNKVVDQFGDNAAIQSSLVRREKLPLTVAERLVAVVSENLRDYLVSHHELPPSIAVDLVLESRERATVSLLPHGSESVDVIQLCRQLKLHGRLTPSLLLRALCMGDVAFFESAMSVLARTPIVNARMLIHDDGTLGLKSLYLRSGLPERLYPAFRVAVDVMRENEFDARDEDRRRYICRMIERILTQFEDIGQDNLDYLLTKLNQYAA